MNFSMHRAESLWGAWAALAFWVICAYGGVSLLMR
jgi:hypothetical protein